MRNYVNRYVVVASIAFWKICDNFIVDYINEISGDPRLSIPSNFSFIVVYLRLKYMDKSIRISYNAFRKGVKDHFSDFMIDRKSVV